MIEVEVEDASPSQLNHPEVMQTVMICSSQEGICSPQEGICSLQRKICSLMEEICSLKLENQSLYNIVEAEGSLLDNILYQMKSLWKDVMDKKKSRDRGMVAMKNRTKTNNSFQPVTVNTDVAEAAGTHSVAAGTPSEAADTPSEAAGTLSVTTGTPSDAADTPSEAAGTPSLAAGTSSEATWTLSETVGTPSVADVTPSESSGTPSVDAGNPSDSAGTLYEAAKTLSQAADTPFVAAGTPSEAAGTPSEAAGTSSEGADTPSKASGTSPGELRQPGSKPKEAFGEPLGSRTWTKVPKTKHIKVQNKVESKHSAPRKENTIKPRQISQHKKETMKPRLSSNNIEDSGKLKHTKKKEVSIEMAKASEGKVDSEKPKYSIVDTYVLIEQMEKAQLMNTYFITKNSDVSNLNKSHSVKPTTLLGQKNPLLSPSTVLEKSLAKETYKEKDSSAGLVGATSLRNENNIRTIKDSSFPSEECLPLKNEASSTTETPKKYMALMGSCSASIESSTCPRLQRQEHVNIVQMEENIKEKLYDIMDLLSEDDQSDSEIISDCESEKKEEKPTRVSKRKRMVSSSADRPPRKRKTTEFFGEHASNEDVLAIMRSKKLICVKKTEEKPNNIDEKTRDNKLSLEVDIEQVPDKLPKDNRRRSKSISRAVSPTSPRPAEVQTNLLRLSKIELIQCPHCQEYFTEGRLFKHHISKDHPHNCMETSCACTFVKRINMIKHVKQACHGDVDKYLRLCELCGSYIDIKSMCHHKPEKHTLKCPKCCLSFTNDKELLQHFVNSHLK